VAGCRPVTCSCCWATPERARPPICLHAAFHRARQGDHVAFVTTFSEAPEKMLRHADSFSFYDEELVDERIHVRNLYPLVGQDLDKLRGALVETVEEHDAKLLVVDGLASVRDLQDDDHRIRRFIHDLGAGARGAGLRHHDHQQLLRP
jgi:KaiC/GvpD/RAD55 family RecA-like ATPase